jgi:hypothetical protein
MTWTVSMQILRLYLNRKEQGLAQWRAGTPSESVADGSATIALILKLHQNMMYMRPGPWISSDTSISFRTEQLLPKETP